MDPKHRAPEEPAGITQWPNWKCVNCHREFPPTTTHRKCPGQLEPNAGGESVLKPCGGYLVRYKFYQRR